MDGKNLMVYVGFSHPVEVEPTDGITFEVEAKTRQIKVIGIDNELVGQVAADIRKIRPPSLTRAKEFITWARISVANPANLAKTKAA